MSGFVSNAISIQLHDAHVTSSANFRGHLNGRGTEKALSDSHLILLCFVVVRYILSARCATMKRIGLGLFEHEPTRERRERNRVSSFSTILIIIALQRSSAFASIQTVGTFKWSRSAAIALNTSASLSGCNATLYRFHDESIHRPPLTYVPL